MSSSSTARPAPAAQSHDHFIEKMLASYEKFGGLNRSEDHNMPSKHAVAEICQDLLQLLFPGFLDDRVVQGSSLEEITRLRFNHLLVRLEDQVSKSLCIADGSGKACRAPQILREFCQALHIVREVLHTDIEAAYENDPAARSREEIILSYPFVEAIAIQRLAHRLYRAGASLIARMMTEWAHGRTGIDIHPGASIGAHFFIDHGTGVVIGETCRIGNHVRIYHGVTLGARNFIKDEDGHIVKGLKRHPDVGDNVIIFPNSTILGGSTVIGANSTIGANVFLMTSVPPDSLVIYEERQVSVLHKKSRHTDALDWSI